MELLGHSQMRTTMDIYSHVMPALAREAADRMGDVLLGGRAPIEPARTPAIEGGLQPIATKVATTRNHDDHAEGSSPLEMGGAEGTRTPDPHTASVVRYQLRHSPLRSTGTRPPTRLQRYTGRPGRKRQARRQISLRIRCRCSAYSCGVSAPLACRASSLASRASGVAAGTPAAAPNCAKAAARAA